MKKKFLLLPLLMLVLASCGPKGDSNSDPSGSEPSGDPTSDTSGDPSSDTPSDTSGDSSGDTSSDTSSDPSSDTSSGEDDEKQEIDPAGLNAILGFDVYSLLPKIYSNNYLVDDWSSTSYPVDVYVDLFDWELADAEAYELALSTSLELDEENGYVIQDNLYVFIYLDDETYAPDEVFGLNIYSIAEPAEKEEIDPTDLNTALGFDVYSLLPTIYSNDYDVFDESSEDYPVDVYVYLWDWLPSDVAAYDAELALSLDYDDNYGYIIEDGLYVFANFDSNFEIGYINIYSVSGGGSVEPEGLLLDDGETIVLYNSSQAAFSSEELESKSGWYANNDICNFNGNDQIALSNDGVVIDMVGVLGSSADYAKDTTLVRNASVSSPTETYSASEWTSSAKDTVSNVGNHTMDAVASDLIISEYVEGSGYNKFIEIYNGTGEAVDLVNYSVTLYVNGSADSSSNKTFEFSSLLVI